ncbi:hypothetical protein BAE44_0018778 [Dichanthelium oligosanthes]|uniref:Reverse transcriptase zinc-binding domain-containing protein n=1 Tax=Dichanthelium oligosanthes TaxID=888268 RepID=A0A1E5V4X5_9POAL|nr:hypothetical protein BAE44_0018778 [Dichanthelium oligosanthes]
MVDHLLLQCVFSREVWFRSLRRLGWSQLAPTPVDSLTVWWLRSRKKVVKVRRKAFDSLCFLISRSLWLERNSRVFRGASCLPGSLVVSISDSVLLWVSAGLVDRSALLGV